MVFDALELLQPAAKTTDELATVLVVEDDEGQREALTYRLRQQGYRVAAACSGKEALELALCERPQLVLMDLRLPDMEGFALCERLADDSITCGVPIIILSGMERPDIIRRSRSAGCQYFVRKPYDPNALLVLIESALNEAA